MALIPMPVDTDPQSLLMSELAVCVFLGTDGKGIRKLIQRGKLRRDELTGAFYRKQVKAVHDQIVGEFDSPTTEKDGEHRLTPILN